MVERPPAGAGKHKHGEEDGEIDCVLCARRVVEDQIAAAAMTGERGNKHVDRKRKGNRTCEEPQGKEDAAPELNNSSDPGIEKRKGHAKILKPSGKGRNTTGIGWMITEFARAVNDDADAKGNSDDKECEVEQRIGSRE